MNSFTFDVLHEDSHSHARTGVIHTPHGDIQTPAFVPVGTQATVKSLSPEELLDLEVSLFFVNTYHMYLRPGLSIVEKAGGLHTFMGWNNPIITDSGGFQVFSLGRKRYARKNEDNEGEADLVRISEDGVEFRSHWDGSLHTFTPERSMQYQWILGSDIHIAFDDCTNYPVTQKVARLSMERTHRWAIQSLQEHQVLAISAKARNRPYQALYGSIQGSVFEDLRKESVAFITSQAFDGFAVGGVSVGETKEEMRSVMDWVAPSLPPKKPRHLLGVGELDDIFALVDHGFDTFDCVQPTRLARMGFLYLRKDVSELHESRLDHTIDIQKQLYADQYMPVDEGCHCYTCTHFTRAYLHHLFKVRELFGYRLATIHNIFFINRLVKEIRLAIESNSFVALKEQWNM
jgi:tRNA-guanine transglycosylase